MPLRPFALAATQVRTDMTDIATACAGSTITLVVSRRFRNRAYPAAAASRA